MAKAKTDDIIGWIKVVGFSLITLLVIIAIWELFQGMTKGLANLGTGVGDVATLGGTTLTKASAIATGAEDIATSLLGDMGLGTSTTDQTKIPNYAAGNWQKLMADPNNPLSENYRLKDPNSKVNPGPTALIKNWGDPIYQYLHDTFGNADPDIIITLFEGIPDRDHTFLVYDYINGAYSYDLAQDIGSGGTFFSTIIDSTLQDTIGTIILNKS